MNSSKLILISGLVGALLGVFFTCWFLGAFGNEQLNNAYVTEIDLSLKQNGQQIYIPKGSSIQLYKSIDGQPYYRLHFVGEPFISNHITQTEKWDYYFLHK